MEGNFVVTQNVEVLVMVLEIILKGTESLILDILHSNISFSLNTFPSNYDIYI